VLDLSAPQTVKLNENFKVEVVASEAKSLYGANFVLEFDPALADFVDVAEGGFLKKDGKPTTFGKIDETKKGRLGINTTRVGKVNGVGGSGVLAVVSFKAKAKGAVNVGFGGAQFFAPGGAPIDADMYSTVIEVK